MKKQGFYIFIFTFYLWLVGCSIPNFEPPECTQSREAVRDFYSFHIGNDMKFSLENLKLREKFLSPELYKSLKNVQNDADIFTTNGQDFPKTFRVGGCKVIDTKKTNVEVIFFWKTDTRTEQKIIHAETVNENGKWLINKVEK